MATDDGALLDGAHLILRERQRQQDFESPEGEGYTADHDDRHEHDEIAWAAVCYAAPYEVLRVERSEVGTRFFMDPWPWGWQDDKRQRAGEDGGYYDDEARVRELVKAGALIAAEIDRLNRRIARR